MRRVWLCLLTAAFLSLVGLQASHAHGDESQAPKGCTVCALGERSVRALPETAPALVDAPLWTEFSPARFPRPQASLRRESHARAPPAR